VIHCRVPYELLICMLSIVICPSVLVTIGAPLRLLCSVFDVGVFLFRAGSASEKLSLNDLRMLFGLEQSDAAFKSAGFAARP